MITPLIKFRKLTPVVLGLALFWTTLGCESNTYQSSGQPRTNTVSTQVNLGNGSYPLKQANYNDANGQYTLFLFNATPPVFSTSNLQMMPLTEAEIKAGQQSYLQMQNNQAILHLSQDFQIAYIHAVTQQVNGAKTIIVREESTYWEPFDNDNELEIDIDFDHHRPHYYVPPPYQAGALLTKGYYAPTYQEAVAKYEQNHKTQPPAVKNNQLRTSGVLRKSTDNKSTASKTQSTTDNKSAAGKTQSTTDNKSTASKTQSTTDNKSTAGKTQSTTDNKSTTTTTAPSSSSTKATGSGYSSSNLKKSSQAKPQSSSSKKSSSSFGSSKGSSSKSSSSSKKR